MPQIPFLTALLSTWPQLCADSPGSCSLSPGTSSGLPAGCGHCQRGRLLLKELLLQESSFIAPPDLLGTPHPRGGCWGLVFYTRSWHRHPPCTVLAAEGASCGAVTLLWPSRALGAALLWCPSVARAANTAGLGAACYKTGAELRFLFSSSLPGDGRAFRSGTLRKG